MPQVFDSAREAGALWASWPLDRRRAILGRWFDLLVRDQERIIDLLQAESGKARRTASNDLVDVLFVTGHYLKTSRKLLAPQSVSGPVPVVTGSTVLRKPLGVVVVIAPWNFPMATGIGDAVPALLAGNAVILKPDNQTALSTLYAVRLLHEAGLPHDVVQVVCADGGDLGEELITSADHVMFTGSAATGRIIAAQAGAAMVPHTLELGGKNPMIVLADADVDAAVAGAVMGCFDNAGQLCMHMERLYVHDSIYTQFRDELVAALGALDQRQGYDYGAELGALISERQLESVDAHVQEAVAKGATALTGGAPRLDLGPTFYPPTVLEGVTEEMALCREEVFGPVVALERFGSVDDVIAKANDTAYGLNASVWGRDVNAAQAVAARIEAGCVNVNDTIAVAYSSKGAPQQGAKGSGRGSRHGDEGLLKYTRPQIIGVAKRQVLGTAPGTTHEAFAKQVATTFKLLGITKRLGR
ncbi:MAG: aldehyde dehydrogenase family protein [Tetrasphaera sp.]|nr:aldehyde dehydrogenase family protein [Tetrasphaera sp.]